ncbi:MAG: nucleotidyltransferase domain-containing protein [Calditrichia bacterium]
MIVENPQKISIDEVIIKAEKFLQSFDYLDFALLFGSYIKNTAGSLSDIDIGIYANRGVELLELGFLTAKMESLLKIKVDLIVLNNLYKKNPTISFEIASTGKLIFCKNENLFIDFKSKSYLYYLDAKYLRDMVNRRFEKRLKEGLFGVRNNVRKA